MNRYIDADKLSAHKFTTQEANHNDMGGAYRQGWNDAIDAVVDDQPTADVRENVRGEWIEDNSREKSMMWRCSVCGRIAYYPTFGKRKSYKKHCDYNYCPSCGAQMMRGGS